MPDPYPVTAGVLISDRKLTFMKRISEYPAVLTGESHDLIPQVTAKIVLRFTLMP